MTAAVSTFPKVIAVLSVTDAGPGGGATCPHCGAEGRYVNWFLCDDGKKRGAMAGCFELFPKAHGRVAALTAEAFRRVGDANATGQRVAGWWLDIIAATDRLAAGDIDTDTHSANVLAAEGRRQAYLSRFRRRGGAR